MYRISFMLPILMKQASFDDISLAEKTGIPLILLQGLSDGSYTLLPDTAIKLAEALNVPFTFLLDLDTGPNYYIKRCE